MKGWLGLGLAVLVAFAPTAWAQPPKPAYVGSPFTSGALATTDGKQSVSTSNLSGDCTTSGSLATICLKTNGVSFGYFATGTDASNLTGNLSISRFNSGTGASSTTYWRGDGTWATPAGSGSLTVTDGTNTVSGATQITFSGATVGGTSPNATVTVSGGGGGSYPWTVRPPTTALFTTSASGTGVTTSITGGSHFYSIIRTDTGAGSGERVAFQGKTIPAGSSWTATATIVGASVSNVVTRFGLAMYDTSTGKSVLNGYQTISSGATAYTPSLTNNTFLGLNGGYGTFYAGWDLILSAPIMFRITWNGTSFTFQMSLNAGDSWTTLSTQTPAALGFTPTHIGLMIETYNTFTSGQPRVDCIYYSDPDFP